MLINAHYNKYQKFKLKNVHLKNMHIFMLHLKGKNEIFSLFVLSLYTFNVILFDSLHVLLYSTLGLYAQFRCFINRAHFYYSIKKLNNIWKRNWKLHLKNCYQNWKENVFVFVSLPLCL